MWVMFLNDLRPLIKYLKNKRIEKGFSINQLSMYSGVSASQISRMESGERTRPKLTTLLKLSRTLGLADNEFLVGSGYLAPDSGFDEFMEAYDRLTTIDEKRYPQMVFSSLTDDEKEALETLLEDPKETRLFRDFLTASKEERLSFLRAWKEMRRFSNKNPLP